MTENHDSILPRGCRFIRLPKISDGRGSLSFGEGMNQIPFQIKRIFWTYDITDRSMRGDHAHRVCQMVLFPLGGSYRIELDDGSCKHEVLMNDPSVGVLVPPLVWCRLYDFTKYAACISLASEPYTAEDYIHDYKEFLQLTKR